MGNIGLKSVGSILRCLGFEISLQHRDISQGGKTLVRKAAETEDANANKKRKLQLTDDDRMTEEATTYISADIQSLCPPEIIFEILSWLPVKSLLRMRCVSKSWHDLTMDRYFTMKHMNRGAPFYRFNEYGHSTASPYACKVIYGSDGLILKRNFSTGKYYIENEAIQQKMDLPNPHKNSFGITLSFVPSVDQYKLVSIYDTTEQGIFGEGWEILTAGIDDSWRPLMPKLLNVNKKHKTISVVAAGEVVYCIRVSKIGSNICLEIVSLYLESESFTYAALPEDLFPHGSEIWPLNWNGQLAFAYRVQEDLKVLVAENYKKLKWCVKKIVVPLQFEASEAILLNHLVPHSAQSGMLWFWLEGSMIFSYNIASRKIIHKIFPSEGCQIARGPLYVGTKSLVTLRGMQPYDRQWRRSLLGRFKVW